MDLRGSEKVKKEGGPCLPPHLDTALLRHAAGLLRKGEPAADDAISHAMAVVVLLAGAPGGCKPDARMKIGGGHLEQWRMLHDWITIFKEEKDAGAENVWQTRPQRASSGI